eukprot:3551854-Rhodomonas_salina.1
MVQSAFARAKCKVGSGVVLLRGFSAISARARSEHGRRGVVQQSQPACGVCRTGERRLKSPQTYVANCVGVDDDDDDERDDD